jgi:excisionase family DNA binding protein
MHRLEKSGYGASETRETPLLVSVPEAARLLGVGTTFGWAMVRSGELPSVKLGRRVLVPRAALERLASAHEHGSDDHNHEPDDPDGGPRVIHPRAPFPHQQAERQRPS